MISAISGAGRVRIVPTNRSPSANRRENGLLEEIDSVVIVELLSEMPANALARVST
jgi:hypothetical protein